MILKAHSLSDVKCWKEGFREAQCNKTPICFIGAPMKMYSRWRTRVCFGIRTVFSWRKTRIGIIPIWFTHNSKNWSTNI